MDGEEEEKVKREGKQRKCFRRKEANTGEKKAWKEKDSERKIKNNERASERERNHTEKPE